MTDLITAPRTGDERRTFLPRHADDLPEGPRREVRGATFRQRYDLIGAGVAAAALAALLFGWFAPLSGPIGWVVVAFGCFLALYVLLVSRDNGAMDVRDRLATVLFGSAGVVVFSALLFIVVYTLVRGVEALQHGNFFTQTMQFAGPLDPLTAGGVMHAIVGTLIQISIALAITIPLGVGTAVYLNEVGGRFARLVRTISDAMTALPSIVAGLFVYAAIIQGVTHERSGFAAAVAITVMMLPVVIRSADVVLRLVPQNLREASYALGSSRWNTVRHVVLPTAKSGLVTSVILGTARGIGETSPVLLTSGVTAALNVNPFSGPMISLPLQVFDFVRSPEPTMIARGFGAAAVLMVLVLVLFIVARTLGGRGPGELTPRQQRAVRAASKRDVLRFSTRAGLESSVEVTINEASTTPDPDVKETP
ncbi:phosphate ABC transporter permease PstA [Tessaracoccus sp. OS52]|uniref:phosphate ABC transporter permease PstA n=1 Tax=Tessaracoccus sp. OS52 TaxID=2886691 RepID=UPI001D0F8885|nr:phosphate ABC transporter permease PstA [Tessaracoccus sp. OS52]MCC2594187.1 phosphate ABC transporter permease PstA [Tessaracoccus sp. OS52]